MMGGSDSPGYPQQWAASIREVANTVVRRPVANKHLMGNGVSQQQLEDLEVLKIAVMYMDDGKTRNPACFTLEQAREHFFQRCCVLVTSMELNTVKKQSVWPGEPGSPVGVTLCIDAC